MRRYLSMLKPYKWWVVLALLMGTFTVGANMGLMSTSAYLIAKAAQHPYTILLLWVPIVGVRFFGTSRGVFRYLERYISHDVTFQLLKELRVFVYRHLEPLIPGKLGSYHSGDLLSRVVGDIDVLQNLYLGLFSPPIIAILTFVMAVAFMNVFGYPLAMALAVFLLVSGFVVPFLTQWMANRTSGAMVRARAALSTELVEIINGNTDILALGQEANHLNRLQASIQQWTKRRMFLHWISGLGAALMQGLNNGAMWMILVIGIELVSTHHLAPVLLPVVVLLSLASFEAVNALPAAFQFRGQVAEAALRINELVAERPPARSGTVRAEDILQQGNPPTVAFDDVHFAYGQHGPEILRGMQFTIAAGTHVAIVGPSGAGKTTVAGIVSGLWPYQHGQVLFNGVALDEVYPQDLAHLVSVVEQEPHLFNTTLRQNLLLANPDATEAQLMAAVQMAQLSELVSTLPKGLETVVGDQGAQLSGGERKRIAIARVILQNTPIVVMDEATEGLDALTEREIIHALRKWAAHKTMIWITHRLSNLDAFDGVIVLSHGEVVESGPAKDLVRQNGLFTRMLIAEEQSVTWTAAKTPHHVASV
ncbi:thiol reductant ABC exporter subunit CydC [Sulfobacillus thermosulfidooxidans]|uniref:thiol reductant ABC exporter subunit CydC n=1 Tax=Sulfobacillus thermosulfidooxidans TaxID=28034 RepID=UPI00041225CF|nr:thiol reductant ABC exporter subunit CydC [Sulfobacillus thermosulfidooxidans]